MLLLTSLSEACHVRGPPLQSLVLRESTISAMDVGDHIKNQMLHLVILHGGNEHDTLEEIGDHLGDAESISEML